MDFNLSLALTLSFYINGVSLSPVLSLSFPLEPLHPTTFNANMHALAALLLSLPIVALAGQPHSVQRRHGWQSRTPPVLRRATNYTLEDDYSGQSFFECVGLLITYGPELTTRAVAGTSSLPPIPLVARSPTSTRRMPQPKDLPLCNPIIPSRLVSTPRRSSAQGNPETRKFKPYSMIDLNPTGRPYTVSALPPRSRTAAACSSPTSTLCPMAAVCGPHTGPLDLTGPTPARSTSSVSCRLS